MMKLFLDTEFTQLNHEAKLISIALINENEDGYYAELTDTYTESDCSEFVKQNVLPYLRGGSYRKTFSQVAYELGNWIEDQSEECVIANDAPTWDMPFLKTILEECWPSNLLKDRVYLIIPDYSRVADLIKTGNLTIHNSYDDALVMKRLVVDK